jgi:hypothetical protein
MLDLCVNTVDVRISTNKPNIVIAVYRIPQSTDGMV